MLYLKQYFLLITLIFSFNVAFGQEIRLKYKPPFIPASISVGSSGVDLTFEPSIATPIGTFSLEYSKRLMSNINVREQFFVKEKILL
jgi:hypothetical protein